jgi:hypothetical protein
LPPVVTEDFLKNNKNKKSHLLNARSK